MNVLLALGANQGDRLENLEQAAAALHALSNVTVVKTSSVFETEALTPENAPDQWDLPFYNMALSLETTLDPSSLLDATQAIERHLGRTDGERWAPRPIDIDIVAYGEERIDSARLQIPHPEAFKRAFVLAPCSEIDPTRRLPGCGDTLLAARRKLPQQLPAWMRIVNVTPDSFSGDGQLQISAEDDASNANYIDVGAESTRPGATSIDPRDEWARLEPALDGLFSTRHVRPRLSVDTRNVSTAERALALGVDMINDVSGLVDDRMIELLAGNDCDIVLMHSLSVPSDPKQVLTGADPVVEITNWFVDRLAMLDRRGIDPARVILDPGIGFGKTAAQSMQIIIRAREFTSLGQRLLVGHSRKSYLQTMTSVPAADRDVETLAVSEHLADVGIDILRVHAHDLHSRFWRVHSRLARNGSQGVASR